MPRQRPQKNASNARRHITKGKSVLAQGYALQESMRGMLTRAMLGKPIATTRIERKSEKLEEEIKKILKKEMKIRGINSMAPLVEDLEKLRKGEINTLPPDALFFHRLISIAPNIKNAIREINEHKEKVKLMQQKRPIQLPNIPKGLRDQFYYFHFKSIALQKELTQKLRQTLRSENVKTQPPLSEKNAERIHDELVELRDRLDSAIHWLAEEKNASSTRAIWQSTLKKPGSKTTQFFGNLIARIDQIEALLNDLQERHSRQKFSPLQSLKLSYN